MEAALESLNAWLKFLDVPLFVVLPYLAVFTMLLVTIQRYRSATFTYSSLSSQFLENRQHFWAVVPMHYGVLVVVAGHIVALAVPRTLLLWNSHPLRLYILEVFALSAGLITLIGTISVVLRRLTSPKVRVVTTTADWVLFALLLLQIGAGVYVAVMHPWGSSWFAASAAPYLWSLILLKPEIAYVADMPLAVKLHIVNAFVLIGFFPFTRLVHILVTPNPYLWRKPQVVRWYGRQ
jgi:nitrate reductase gamma subunit